MTIPAVLLAVAAVGGLAQAQADTARPIVLSGSTSPASWGHVYTTHCPGGRDYSLELSQEEGRPARLYVRYSTKVEPVKGPGLLAETAGMDLYSVHMACTENGAEFHTMLRKVNGRQLAQMIVVNDSVGVSSLPARAVASGK